MATSIETSVKDQDMSPRRKLLLAGAALGVAALLPGKSEAHTGASGARYVETVNDLKGLSSPSTVRHVITLGYHSAGDGGHGEYVIVPFASTANDNESTQIRITGTSYVAILQFGEMLNVMQFGAKNNGTDPSITTPAIQAAIDHAEALASVNGFGATVYFPRGSYVTSGTLIVQGNNIILRGEGAGSIIVPSSYGSFDTLVVEDGHNVVVQDLTIKIRNNYKGIDWRSHQGGIFRCYFLPESSSASNVTAIRLDQSSASNGSWITDIQNCMIGFNQATTATGCIGIDLVGNANRINILNNSISGFNGWGIRLSQYDNSCYPNGVVIAGNDIESMESTSQTNYAIEIRGKARQIIIENNYFEGINGTNSRFVRAGYTGYVYGFTFRNNVCFGVGSLPASWYGFDLDKVYSPVIESNSFSPGAGTINITANTNLWLPGELESPVKFQVNLLNQTQTAYQSPAAVGVYENISAGKEYVQMETSAPHIYKLVIVYQSNNNSSYTFAVKNYYGSVVTQSEVTGTGSGVYKIEKIFVHSSIPDLTYLQVKINAATGGGCRVMSARLYVC